MILAVGGVDSSGGAGLEQDRRVAERLNCPLRAAVTAVTLQGVGGVQAVEPVSPSLLENQLKTHMEEDSPSSVKVGALFSSPQIRLVRDFLKEWRTIRRNFFVLADPVFSPSRGTSFLNGEDIDIYRTMLPFVDILTPNRRELEILDGGRIQSVSEGEAAGIRLAREYGMTVILKGGHFPGKRMEERVIRAGEVHTFRKRSVELARSHGTGCALATALCVYMIKGYSVEKAFSRASRMVSREMRRPL